MATKKLTNVLRDDIAYKAIKDRYVPSLQDGWRIVCAGISRFCKETIYANFDFDNSGPYEAYINWHKTIDLCSLPGDWNLANTFSMAFDLYHSNEVALDFAVPSRNQYSPDIPNEYRRDIENILRPYAVQYLQAERAWYDIKKVLSGLTTFKQVEEIVPELTRYLPVTPIEQVNALIPIEQINRVRALFSKEDR
jgi:hypothetical protein